MRLNGNLVLNTGGQSQITNAIFDRVASLPSFTSSEAGRVVFLTSNSTYYFNNGTDAYVAFATGGNAADLQTEVDAIETSLGSIVSGSGTFNSAALNGTAAEGATSLTQALTMFNAAISGKDQLSELTDVSIGTKVEGDVLAWNATTSKWEDSSALVDEVAARIAAVAAEQTARTAADATLTSGLAAEVTARQATDAALAAETTARTAADTAINARITAMYFLYDGASGTTHTVSHNLGQRYCNVTVVETATNEVIIPQGIVFDTANQLTVTFNAGIACKVIVMGLA